MDVGYIVRSGANEELRYSLRSLSNLPHDRVFIAGSIPPWARNVTRLPRDQGSRRKFVNSALNLYALCDSGISEDFVFFNDDFFVMRPTDEIPTMHRGTLKDVQAKLAKRYGLSSSYVAGMEATRAFLADNYDIHEPLSYGLHIPMVVNKTLMRTILLATNVHKPVGRANYHMRTIYGNVAEMGGERMSDVKVSTTSSNRYRPGQLFVSTSDRSFVSGVIGRTIKAAFPEPSQYEQQSPSLRR